MTIGFKTQMQIIGKKSNHCYCFVIAGALFLYLFAPSSAFARNYDVEILVFDKPIAIASAIKNHLQHDVENNKEKSLSDIKQQHYLNQFEKLNKNKVRAVYSPDTNINATSLELSEEELNPKTLSKNEIRLTQVMRLKTIQQRLIESGYRILINAKWTQPAKVYRHAPVVSLSNLQPLISQAYIKIYKTSLIFANVDIAYNLPIHTIAPNRQAITPLTFFMAEKRRLKFKEIHYFDHPQFGAIIGVWSANN